MAAGRKCHGRQPFEAGASRFRPGPDDGRLAMVIGMLPNGDRGRAEPTASGVPVIGGLIFATSATLFSGADHLQPGATAASLAPQIQADGPQPHRRIERRKKTMSPGTNQSPKVGGAC